MNPFIVDDSRERYQVRLDEAEQWRQATRARANRVSRVVHLRMRIGDQLAVGLSAPQFDEAPPA
jgi:hypothetical protein